MEKHINYHTLAKNLDLSPDLRMTLAPYRSIRQACIAEHVANSTILSKLIRGKQFKGWRPAGARIAEHFGLIPEDAFPRYDWRDGKEEIQESRDGLERYDERVCLAAVMVSLSDREAAVLRMHFGLDGTPSTLGEIAKALGVTECRVGQIRRRALRKLRHPSNLRLLAELR